MIFPVTFEELNSFVKYSERGTERERQRETERQTERSQRPVSRIRATLTRIGIRPNKDTAPDPMWSKYQDLPGSGSF